MRLFIKRNRRVFIFATVVVFFLFGVGIVQLLVNQYQPYNDTAVVKVEDNEENTSNDETDDPQAPEEKLAKPVSDDIEIVKKFYDASLSDDEREQALVYFEGVYRPNLGIDYANDDKAFEVIAACSGTVTKKENDPLLGWVVTVTNETGVATTYQSLSEVTVDKDAVIKQGDKTGTSGKNVYESELNNHLHFILEKDNQALNPEKYFDLELSKIAL